MAEVLNIMHLKLVTTGSNNGGTGCEPVESDVIELNLGGKYLQQLFIKSESTVTVLSENYESNNELLFLY